MAHSIQIILTQRLASYLSIPVFLVDEKGDLIFYNEPAESFFGQRFDETGAMPAAEWSTAFAPEDADGRAIAPGDLPLMITLTKRQPTIKRFFLGGEDGSRRHLEVASIPITGLADEFLGAAAFFWELPE